MKRHVLVAVVLCAGILSVAGAKEASSCKIRVACIGDSITWGYAMTNRVVECYPAQLQRMLGDGGVFVSGLDFGSKTVGGRVLRREILKCQGGK